MPTDRMDEPTDLETAEAAAKRTGRRRDTAVRDRILRAGIEVFATDGWRGFSLDTVARAAHVGKSSIYLRYATRQELMLDILKEYGYLAPAGFNSGDLFTDLRALADYYARWLDGPAGILNIRMAVEARLNPDLAEAVADYRAAGLGQAHKIIRQAKQRGELPKSASAAVILDSLIGAIMLHKLTEEEVSVPAFSSPAGQKYIDELVSSVTLAATTPRTARPAAKGIA